MKKMHRIQNEWFFADTPWWLKWTLIFIKGDSIILLPLIGLLLLIAFYSIRFAFLMSGVYIALRYLGEMVYWLLQQFGKRTYRPYDFGFKKLDNHALYILYQLMSLFWIITGTGIVAYVLLYLYRT